MNKTNVCEHLLNDSCNCDTGKCMYDAKGVELILVSASYRRRITLSALNKKLAGRMRINRITSDQNFHIQVFYTAVDPIDVTVGGPHMVVTKTVDLASLNRLLLLFIWSKIEVQYKLPL